MRRKSFSFMRWNRSADLQVLVALFARWAHGTLNHLHTRVRAAVSHAGSGARPRHCGYLSAARDHCRCDLRIRPSWPFVMRTARHWWKHRRPLPQETKPGTEPGVAHANDAGTATSRASAEAPTPRSGETSAQAAAPPPPSAIAPKTRVVRIRRAVDSPAIARLPLGRGEAPASPPDDPAELSQTSNAAAPAGNEVAAVATEKPVARSGAKESVAASPPPKKAQRTVRNASSRRNYIENDPWLRDERQDDWRARAAAVNDARNPVGRANARDGAASFRGFWDWSR